MSIGAKADARPQAKPGAELRIAHERLRSGKLPSGGTSGHAGEGGGEPRPPPTTVGGTCDKAELMSGKNFIKSYLQCACKCVKCTFRCTIFFSDFSTMPPITPATTHTVTSDGVLPDEALMGAMSRLLAPLARLCLANGINFAAAEEMFKRAFVQEANDLQPEAPA